MLERAREIASMARHPSHGHRKAHHRHDVSFLMGRAGVAAVQLHLAHLAGGDPAAEANLLEVQSLKSHTLQKHYECCRHELATDAACWPWTASTSRHTVHSGSLSLIFRCICTTRTHSGWQSGLIALAHVCLCAIELML